MRGEWAGRAGGVVLAVWVVLGLAAPFLSPYDPRAQNRSRIHAPPSSSPHGSCELVWWAADDAGATRLLGFRGCDVHLLGTDALGRDVLSRVLHGARWSAGAVLLGVAATALFGSLVGAVAGLRGGLWDVLLMRGAELFTSIPALYLLLAVRNVFPARLSPGTASLILVGSLAAVGWCGVSRLVRSQVLSLREQEFVTAAVAAGASSSWVLSRHILPHLFPFLLLQTGILLPGFLLGEATLSFLGLGIPEPEPSWGGMLADAAGSYTAMTTYWWVAVAPGAALTTTVLAANCWIEGLRASYFSAAGAEAGPGSKQRLQRAS